MPLVESRKRNCWPELPDGNGLNLAKQLKLRPETKTIPIIFVTASKDSKLRESAMMMGIAGLVEKPYDPEELLETSSPVLARDRKVFSVPCHIRRRRTKEAGCHPPP